MKKINLIIILLVSNLSFTQTANSDCLESLTLSTNEVQSNYTYNSQNSITTTGNYKVDTSNDEIRMKAGVVIVLKPNTYIQKNALYLARIEPCILCEINFSFSNFFTPNDDNYNDLWNVNWNDPADFSVTSIFDRYGKLIITLKKPFEFWDGQYNSTNAVSSDYWFKFEYIDCNGNKKEFRSHFSLKR